MSTLFAIVLSVLAIFLILIVLVQRGRGGGLAGALGGMGGSSAFGAKAGDVFTRITIVTASIWIVVCVLAVAWSGTRGDPLSGGSAAPQSTSPFDNVPPLEGGGALPGEAAPVGATGGEYGTAPPDSGNTPPADGSGSSAPSSDSSESTPASGSRTEPATSGDPAANVPADAPPADDN